ncbi:MAG TPA: hypothetical protein ACFE0H_04710 [Elainellaceae cyanobacterium]
MKHQVETLPVKVTLLLLSTLTVMAGATIAPSLPSMQAVFADTANVEYLVRLVLTIPALFIALGAPIVDVLIDRLGRNRYSLPCSSYMDSRAVRGCGLIR